MIRTNTAPIPMSQMVRKHASQPIKSRPEYEGSDMVVSTGSTLLDLAISGGRFKGGGIPMGIFVEIFGPSGSGKTVLLCEIAGAMQRKGAHLMFHDPEARLNTQFASLFGLDVSKIEYTVPDTVPEVFQSVRNWNPGKGHKGILADSLAALSTELEMDNKEGDKMGMRRAKEFSEELRKTCRIITQENILMVCSNQVRVNHDAGPYGQKYISPGGEAIGFYSSLRLRVAKPEKEKKELKIYGKDEKRIVGVAVTVEVFKSSVWKPYRTAPVSIFFDYGIDDIRQNLKFMKAHSNASYYQFRGEKLSNSLDEAVKMVEDDGLTHALRDDVIELWEEIEEKFKVERKPKQR